MLVKDVMSSPAVTVRAGASAKDGLRLLDQFRVTSLPVTDPQGRIVGIVSEADLLRDAVRPDGRTSMLPQDVVETHPKTVADVMSTYSMTVAIDADLSDAVDLMTTSAVKSLPVLEDGRVVGVISRSDIVHMLARSDEQIRGEVDELLRSAEIESEVEVQDGVVTVSLSNGSAHERIAEVVAGSVAGVIEVRVRA